MVEKDATLILSAACAANITTATRQNVSTIFFKSDNRRSGSRTFPLEAQQTRAVEDNKENECTRKGSGGCGLCRRFSVEEREPWNQTEQPAEGADARGPGRQSPRDG